MQLLKSKRFRRITTTIIVITLVLWIGLGYAVAALVHGPRPKPFPDIEEIAGKPVEPVSLVAADGIPISGWYIAGGQGKACVFTHGIGASRRQAVPNAELYLDRGYGVLLIDTRGHGNNEEGTITVGHDERLDVLAARDYLVERGYTWIGAHGISLGAASIACTMKENPEWDFIVLEQCYDTIENAFNNRIDVVGAPHFLTLPYRFWAQVITGVRPEDLRPVDMAAKMDMPVLVIAGDSEAELKVEETQALYDAIPAEVKHLQFFPGARHQHRLARKQPELFTETVTSFLDAAEAAAPPELATATDDSAS